MSRNGHKNKIIIKDVVKILSEERREMVARNHHLIENYLHERSPTMDDAYGHYCVLACEFAELVRSEETFVDRLTDWFLLNECSDRYDKAQRLYREQTEEYVSALKLILSLDRDVAKTKYGLTDRQYKTLQEIMEDVNDGRF